MGSRSLTSTIKGLRAFAFFSWVRSNFRIEQFLFPETKQGKENVGKFQKISTIEIEGYVEVDWRREKNVERTLETGR